MKAAFAGSHLAFVRPRPTRGGGATAALVTLALAFGACSSGPAATPIPTAVPTAASSAVPTSAATAFPTSAATAAPTVAPTPVPTTSPTPTPVPTPTPRIGLGTVDVALPALESLVETATWGTVPIDQLVVFFADGRTAVEADVLAARLGGRVVGVVEILNAYQVQFPGRTEAELRAALEAAAATAGVVLAVPNQMVVPNEDEPSDEIWGIRLSPLTDPLYASDGSDGYGLVGLQAAWDYIRGSGMTLSPTQVGVVDSGLYPGTGEFDESATITYTAPNANLGEPETMTLEDGSVIPHPAVGHGTAVTTVLAADADDGGPVGVASILGKKLTVSQTNLYKPPFGYGVKRTVADPKDPAIVDSGGASFMLSSLDAIFAEVEAGSKVINLSWGPKDYTTTDPRTSAAFRLFFERMAKERPDVVFVASAGNDGEEMDGEHFFPGGAPLPNVITVGNVNNDGTINEDSNTEGEDFEVSIFAPGDRAVYGYDRSTGKVNNTGGGTSMAAPQVAAAAALMRALDTSLTAAQIKKILVASSREVDGVPVLAIDAAVKAVIDSNCDKAKIPRLTIDELRGRGVIDAVATPVADAPGEYEVRGIVKAIGPKGATITITVTGGTVTVGESPRTLAKAGEPGWTVRLESGKGTIVVRRLDSNAASRIEIDPIDINGHWTGTFTVTNLTVDPEAAPEGEEGCGIVLLDAMKDKPLPMTLDIKVDKAGKGTATVLIDPTSLDLGEDVTIEEPEPQVLPITYAGNRLTFNIPEQEDASATMSGTVVRVGKDLRIDGTLVSGGKGFRATAVWVVTRKA